MKLPDIIKIANEVYGGCTVVQAFENYKRHRAAGTRPQDLSEVGDGLAVFIATELTETYDVKATTARQLSTAHDAMNTAKEQLTDVQDEFLRVLEKTKRKGR